MSVPTLRCADCGEVMPTRHDCTLAIEARALFEAAKKANNPESRNRLIAAAYETVLESEQLTNDQPPAREAGAGGG